MDAHVAATTTVLAFQLFFDEEDDDDGEKNYMRRVRKYLRDISDPFAIPNSEFIAIFRLPKEFVVDVIIPRLSRHLEPSGANPMAIPLHLIVLMGLNYLARGTYQRQLGQDSVATMAQPTISKNLRRFASAFQLEFMTEWIKYPTDEEKNLNKLAFFEKCGLPNIIGVVDGTQVPFVANKFSEDFPENLFVNRKNDHALNVMVVVGPNLWIHHVDASAPGPHHDAFSWRTSSFRSIMMHEWMMNERKQWLLGDSAYPLEPWLMKIYRDPQNPTEKLYNKMVCKARFLVENGIGALKNWCRAVNLENRPHYEAETVAKFVMCAAIMSNMALHTRTAQPPLPPVQVNPQPPLPPTQQQLLNEGIAIRNWLKHNYCQ